MLIASRIFFEFSMVPVYPRVLFGGTGVDGSLQRGKYVLSMEGGWIKFVCATFNVAEYLKEIRLELDRSEMLHTVIPRLTTLQTYIT